MIDADETSAGWLAERLARCGFIPIRSASLHQALRENALAGVKAVIASVGAREGEGAAIARSLRQLGHDRPLMILSARDDWREAIECLDAGADDHLVKPVRSELVAARLRSIIRRDAGNATDKIVLNDLELDLKARCAWLEGKCLNLTRNEFRLLRLLMLEPDRVMTHEHIHRQLGAEDSKISQNAIEVQVARLRRKIGRNRIRTIRGAGYKFVPDGYGRKEQAHEREPCRTCGSYETSPGLSAGSSSAAGRSDKTSPFSSISA